MMTGRAEFNLLANEFGSTLGDLALEVAVTYYVDIGWDRYDRQPTVERVLPAKVEVTVGGNVFHADPWDEVVGPLRAWILMQSKTLDLEALNISREEACEYLSEMKEAA